MEFISDAAPPSPPHPAAASPSPRTTGWRNPPAGVRRRWLSRKMGKLVEAAAPLRRRSQRLVAAAEPPGAQIPAASPPPRQQAKRPPSRRIQSRGSNRRPSSAALHNNNKKKNAPCFGGDDNPALSSIQSLGGKRRCANSPAAWGAKRARSAICCHATPVDPAPASQDVDWANLGDGPAGLIAELVLANDVADYIRFRAVCQPWRRCSPDPRAAGLDDRFLPRRWIMLDKAVTAGPRCHRFLNISTGECIRMDLPELEEHTLLALTPEGLLLLLHEPTLVVRLLNPVTRQLIHFPPVTALLPPEELHCYRTFGESVVEVTGAGLVANCSMLVVRFEYPMVLAVAKPAGESWTVVDDRYISSTWTFAGRFYCATAIGVMVLDTTGTDQQPPQLRVVIERSRSLIRFNAMTHSLHLVDNGGELMLVHRMLCLNTGDSTYKMKYEVYRVDLNAGILIPAKSFNGHTVFIGMCRAISMSAETFPSVTADTLYFGVDCDEKGRMDGYKLADGSDVPGHHNRRVQPSSLVDCLSSSIQGCFPKNYGACLMKLIS